MNPAMVDWPVRQTICGLAELEGFAGAGVTRVLSILDPEAREPDVFAAYAPHDRLTLRFHDIVEPLPDMVPPERAHVEAMLAFSRACPASADEHLLIHCHMGVSRSTAAAVALVLQARPDVADEAVLAHVVGIRPQAWPNARMVAFADDLLDRRGRLIEALAAFQQARAPLSP